MKVCKSSNINNKDFLLIFVPVTHNSQQLNCMVSCIIFKNYSSIVKKNSYTQPETVLPVKLQNREETYKIG